MEAQFNMNFKIGDVVKVPGGKIGKIVAYSNFVYTVEVNGKQNLYGKGELKRVKK